MARKQRKFALYYRTSGIQWSLTHRLKWNFVFVNLWKVWGRYKSEYARMDAQSSLTKSNRGMLEFANGDDDQAFVYAARSAFVVRESILKKLAD